MLAEELWSEKSVGLGCKKGKLILDHRNALCDFLRERAIGVDIIRNFQARMEHQLLHDVVNMALDSVRRYMQLTSYFLVR